jgi:hypothetical protein
MSTWHRHLVLAEELEPGEDIIFRCGVATI